MTREEFFQTLKGCIKSLSEEEQEGALKYYEDYFDDAGDDVKVMQELGSPEEVALIIIDRFSKAKEQTFDEAEESETDAEDKTYYSHETSNALYYEFDSVENVDFNFGAAEVVVIPGEKFSVETRGITEDRLNCNLLRDGTLAINNNKRINLNWFNHDRTSTLIPKILLTIPENASFSRMKIVIGAGSFTSENAGFSCQKGYIEVDAGSMVLNKLDGHDVSLRCGMGSVKIDGKLTGRSNIDCGMGSIKLTLKGSAADYSFDAKVGLGDVRFNDEKKSGVGQIYADNKKENHFSINCGMGSVNISVHRF